MEIRDFLNPKTFIGFSKKDPKNINIPFQIDVSWIKQFKYSNDQNELKFYYVYLMALLYCRNQIHKYRKLSKDDKKTLRKQKQYPKYDKGIFFNIKLDEVIEFASNFTTKHVFKSYVDEILASEQFYYYFEKTDTDRIVNVLSPTNLRKPKKFEDYDSNRILDVTLPLYANMNFKNFVNLCVRILAEIPVKKLSEDDLQEIAKGIPFSEVREGKIFVNSKISFATIAKCCGITEGRVSQILKDHKKYFVIDEITKEAYEEELNSRSGRPVTKVLWNVDTDEETGEIKKTYKYYRFSNVIVESKSHFNYRFNSKFPKDKNGNSGKKSSIKPLSKVRYFSRVAVGDSAPLFIVSNRVHKRYGIVSNALRCSILEGCSLSFGLRGKTPVEALYLFKLNALVTSLAKNFGIQLSYLKSKKSTIGKYIRSLAYFMFQSTYKEFKLGTKAFIALEKIYYDIKHILKAFMSRNNDLGNQKFLSSYLHKAFNLAMIQPLA